MIPLSFAQRRLWFLNKLEGPSATYNVAAVLRLRGSLDGKAMAAALNDVVERHEALRTVFPESEGEPYQQILEGHLELEIVECDPGGLTEALRDAAHHVFDLAAATPPIRATLFAVGPDEHALMIVVHHIAADGWSTAPLLHDLGRAYQSRSQGQVPEWDPLAVQYVDYTLWQAELLGEADDPGSLLAGQLAFWAKELAGTPECLPLPADRPRPPFATYRGDAVPLTVDARLHARIAELARANGVTLFMVLHAALAVLLNRWGAGPDIPIGSPLAGRTDEALDDLVGFFVNTVVVRTDVSGDPSFTELLARVRETALTVLENQDVPFERVVEQLNPERSPSWNPLFQIMLTLQNNTPIPAETLPGLSARIEGVRTSTAKVDLAFMLIEDFDADGRPAGLNGDVVYALDLFDRASAEAAARGLVRVLEAVVAAPEVPVSRVEVLAAGERREVLALGEGPSAGVTQLVPELVASAETALVCGDVVLSFAELSARVNRLARLLIASGVGPEDPVAVLLPRSADSVVAMLGVLTAGAMYVPVDVSYPAERVRFMLNDVTPRVVITTTEQAGLAGTGAPLLMLDVAVTDDLSDGPIGAGIQPSDAAYLIYTSGSTGLPKGVVVTHRSLANLCAFLRRELTEPGRRLRAGLVAALSFDACWNMVALLLSGHELHLLEDDVRRDPQALARYVREQR
ncbi:MAG TPA: condensation domain-containing protein, partial [Amycolatopsis sp.]|nr:condensation domain-containing protein [Amycolatopsis sp.]